MNSDDLMIEKDGSVYYYDSNDVLKLIETNQQQTDRIKELESAPRELSDEEILELTNDPSIFEYREFNDDMIRFARAILKKASEK